MQVSLPPEPRQLRRQLVTSLPSSSLPSSSLPSSSLPISAVNLPRARPPETGVFALQTRRIPLSGSIVPPLKTGGVRCLSEAVIQIRSMTVSHGPGGVRCSSEAAILNLAPSIHASHLAVGRQDTPVPAHSAPAYSAPATVPGLNFPAPSVGLTRPNLTPSIHALR